MRRDRRISGFQHEQRRFALRIAEQAVDGEFPAVRSCASTQRGVRLAGEIGLVDDDVADAKLLQERDRRLVGERLETRHCLNVRRREVTAIPVEPRGSHVPIDQKAYRAPCPGSASSAGSGSSSRTPGPSARAARVDVLAFDGRRGARRPAASRCCWYSTTSSDKDDGRDQALPAESVRLANGVVALLRRSPARPVPPAPRARSWRESRIWTAPAAPAAHRSWPRATRREAH